MTPIAHAVTSALLHFLWQGLLVAVFLWIALGWMRKSSAQARYLAACAALALAAVLPLLTAIAILRNAPAPASSAGAILTLPAIAAAGTGSQSANWLALIQKWALPVWSCGVLIFSLRLMWGCRQISVLKRSGTPADDALLFTVVRLAERMGLRRAVHVVVSSLAEGPGVIGWLKPVILLPAATLLNLPADQLEAVLAHELAHIRRYDYLVNMLQMVAEAVFFYHPAVWWISGRIRHERELCCDDMAVASCGDAVRYAKALTALERLRPASPALALGVADGPLMYRIQRLLGTASREEGPSRIAAAVAAALALACFGLNLDWARAQAPARATQTAQQPGTVRDPAGVNVDLQGSSVMHRTAVPYPEAARAKGVQGKVTLEVTMDASGNVSDARVLSGPEELRKAALQSVLNWHFTRDAAGASRQVSIDFAKPAAPQQEEPKIAQAVLDEQRADELKAAMIQSKAAMEALRAAQAEAGGRAASYLNQEFALAQQAGEVEEMARRARQLNSAERDAEAARLQAVMAKLEEQAQIQRFDNRQLTHINVIGLPADQSADLVSRLPVHEGDTVSSDSLKTIRKAVGEFDEHLEVGFRITGEGKVELRIVAPGSRR